MSADLLMAEPLEREAAEVGWKCKPVKRHRAFQQINVQCKSQQLLGQAAIAWTSKS